MAIEMLYRARAYAGAEDLQPICDMIGACEAEDNGSETIAPDDMRTYIDMPGRDLQRDVRVWDDGEGKISAFAMLWTPPSEEEAGGYLYLQVRPEARPHGLGDEVIGWATERMLEVGTERGTPCDLRCGGKETNTYLLGLLDAHGFTPVRYYFDMSRDLAAPIAEPLFPEGFTLRHVQSERDVEQWVEAYNDSFIDHWDFHPLTIEERKHWLSHPAYRPELDLVAVAQDGTFAAFCWLVINAEDNGRKGIKEGLVDTLGTRRGYRKIGLGRSMLLAGLQKLRDEGMSVARLSVDSENPSGALGLYQSTGFVKTSAMRANWKPLAGAGPLGSGEAQALHAQRHEERKDHDHTDPI